MAFRPYESESEKAVTGGEKLGDGLLILGTECCKRENSEGWEIDIEDKLQLIGTIINFSTRVNVLCGTIAVLRKQEFPFHEADLGRKKLDNTRSGTFWEKNWCLSVCVQWPFGVEFWELLAYMAIETTQGQLIFISAIKSSKGFKSTKVNNYFRASVSKPLWSIQWDSKDNVNCYGIMTFFLEIIDFYFLFYVSGWLGNTYNLIVYFSFFFSIFMPFL